MLACCTSPLPRLIGLPVLEHEPGWLRMLLPQVVVDKGVADPDRIACGGHSYGAFQVGVFRPWPCPAYTIV